MKETCDLSTLTRAIQTKAETQPRLTRLTDEQVREVAQGVHRHFEGRKSRAIAAALLIFVSLTAHATAGGEALTGTASWYSIDSARREGTSGVYTAWCKRGKCAKFKAKAMTFAARRRDFGSLWKITNRNTGRWICARLTDFGPNESLHKAGRKIDLSRGAFVALGGDLDAGILNVRAQKVEACP